MSTVLPDSGQAQNRLIFRWPERRASLVLPIIFMLSVAAHGLAFYLFQVSYPPTVFISPPPAQITLLTPSTPENRTFLAWLDSQDPALPKKPQDINPSGLGEIHYLSSYTTPNTLPKTPEEMPGALAYPPAKSSLELLSPKRVRRELPLKSVASSLSFSKELKVRAPQDTAPIRLSSRSGASLQTSLFLIGVNGYGQIVYSFLQSSCGDRQVDNEAEQLLLQREFKRQAASDALVWGFATFTWGAEAFAVAPPAASATPQNGAVN
jgi:hypothetical protein